MSEQFHIERMVPADFSVAQDVYDSFAFSQNVVFGGLVFISGVMPLRGNVRDIQVISNDLRAQVEFTLGALGSSLDAAGSSMARLLSVTVYASDIDALAQHSECFRDAFGAAPPAATWVQVAKLFHPQQALEISAIAALNGSSVSTGM